MNKDNKQMNLHQAAHFLYFLRLLATDIIKLISKYLDVNTNDSLRQCSKYFYKIVTPEYFSRKIIIAKRINKKNKQAFCNFVQEQKFPINIKWIYNLEQLSAGAALQMANALFWKKPHLANHDSRQSTDACN